MKTPKIGQWVTVNTAEYGHARGSGPIIGLGPRRKGKSRALIVRMDVDPEGAPMRSELVRVGSVVCSWREET